MGKKGRARRIVPHPAGGWVAPWAAPFVEHDSPEARNHGSGETGPISSDPRARRFLVEAGHVFDDLRAMRQWRTRALVTAGTGLAFIPWCWPLLYVAIVCASISTFYWVKFCGQRISNV